MEEEKYWLLMGRYLSNDLTLEETNELLNWVDEKPERTELLQQLQSAWEKTNLYREQSAHFDADIAWQKVTRKLAAEPKPEERKESSFFWLKVAAMLLIAINAGWLAFRYYDNRLPVEVVNNGTSTKLVKLPDSSTVWLNTNSKIAYKKGIGKLAKREVTLSGEAFFEVKPNPQQAFIVASSSTFTEVLGTSFNVKNKDEDVQVSVVTGKVSFRTEDEGEKLTLSSGEAGVFSENSGLLKTKNTNSNFLFWKNRELSFDNERLETVIADVENAYQVKFNVPDKLLLNRRVTTSFKNASFDEVHLVLETLLDRQIIKSGNTCVVK